MVSMADLVGSRTMKLPRFTQPDLPGNANLVNEHAEGKEKDSETPKSVFDRLNRPPPFRYAADNCCSGNTSYLPYERPSGVSHDDRTD